MEAPSWLCFSPCFSNYVGRAKNSSSGALFGSSQHCPRKPAAPLAPAAAPCGTCPFVTSVPASLRGTSGQCASLLGGPNDLGRGLPGAVSRACGFTAPGGGQAATPFCALHRGLLRGGCGCVLGRAGGSGFVIYGSACCTLPRSSFNRCSRGQETKGRGDVVGRGGGGWGNTGVTVGSAGQTDNWGDVSKPLTSIRLPGWISRGSGPRNKGRVCSQSGCLVTYQGSRSKGKERRPLWPRPSPPGP